jgi:hypothetical protein
MPNETVDSSVYNAFMDLPLQGTLKVERLESQITTEGLTRPAKLG